MPQKYCDMLLISFENVFPKSMNLEKINIFVQFFLLISHFSFFENQLRASLLPADLTFSSSKGIFSVSPFNDGTSVIFWFVDFNVLERYHDYRVVCKLLENIIFLSLRSLQQAQLDNFKSRKKQHMALKSLGKYLFSTGTLEKCNF